MKGGWNNKRYYDPFGRPPINEDIALQIGHFLIDSELKRYLSNDDTYYGNNQAYQHVEDEFYLKLKIQLIKLKFKNDAVIHGLESNSIIYSEIKIHFI